MGHQESVFGFYWMTLFLFSIRRNIYKKKTRSDSKLVSAWMVFCIFFLLFNIGVKDYNSSIPVFNKLFHFNKKMFLTQSNKEPFQ